MSSMNPQIPYSREELHRLGPQPAYTGRTASQVAFPLGGIGTGTVSLGGRGQLRDWEIFNRPNPNGAMPWMFFTVRARREGGEPMLKVLEAPLQPPFNPTLGSGMLRESGAGLPHMGDAVFRGEYPFAFVDFSDPDLPVTVSLEAWNPMIPHNDDDSGIPVAILTWKLTNPGDVPVEVTLTGNLPSHAQPGQGTITVRRERGLTALQVGFSERATSEPNHGSIALSTDWPEVTYETHWMRHGWFTPLRDWVDRLIATGRLRDDDAPANEPGDIGSLGLVAMIGPGESVELPVFVTWSFPNFEQYWSDCGCGEGACAKPRWRNYYAAKFPDAWSAARYTVDNLDRLESETRLFHDALFDNTLPAYVLDSISSQMSTIRSTTCLRLPDGTFYGFEGCIGTIGCCEGSCTHVWNYAQTHAFLYPKLERSMREAEYRYSMHPNGKVCFRLQLPLGTPPNDFHACADGQMGAIMQVYRDWQLGAGEEWLRSVWPGVKRAMLYAWIDWDADRDGLMEGVQHNTYDTELHGPNPMCGVPYLGALQAAALMAEHLDDTEFAFDCHRIANEGAKKLDDLLFNGEYYAQPYDPASGLEYQVGDGCLIDQLLGQQLAHVHGLGYLLPQEHVKKTVESIFSHNFRSDFRNVINSARIYALNDEAGTLICTWPRGGRPAVPVPYADEVMIGFEYQLASHLIYEGLVDEGLAVTKAVRDRHDGERRNPWDEFECGSRYARSMANWSIKLALDGFHFLATFGLMRFQPQINSEDYRTFWSTATAWGRYTQRPGEGQYTLEVLYGTQILRSLDLSIPDGEDLVVHGPNGDHSFIMDDGAISFDWPVTLHAGECIVVTRK